MNFLLSKSNTALTILLMALFVSTAFATPITTDDKTDKSDKKPKAETTTSITTDDEADEAQLQLLMAEEVIPAGIFGFGYLGESVGLLLGDNANSTMNYLDLLDINLELSTEGLGLYSGGSLFLQFISNNGADPTSFVGDMQATSNIEANNTQRLYQLWYNQAMMGGAVEVMVGLHDLNTEFYTSEYAGFFNNGSFGIGPDVAANAGASLFNLTTVGARVKLASENGVSFLAAIYDGDPGDPDVNHNGLGIEWAAEEGLMTIGELQFESQTIQHEEADPSVFRVGAWYHTAEFETVNLDSLATVTGNFGLYYSIDYPLSKDLGAFIHGGFAAGDRSPVPSYTGIGIQTLHGSRFFLSNKVEQTFGLALNSAFIAEEGANEIVVEFAWHLQVTENLSIKPDFQYIMNPGGVASAAPALVFSLRTEIGI